MNPAVALPERRLSVLAQPSYADLAEAIVLHRPDLFAHPGGGGGFAVVEERQVQSAPAPRRVAPRRRGGRQLSLPLLARAPGMLG